MIEQGCGNLLEADIEALVNTVNCVGVMGKGLALQFKQAFPDNFAAYKAACKDGQINSGSIFVHITGKLLNPRYVMNFPTKRHWRDRSRREDIQSGLRSLTSDVERLQIQAIAIPPLGCGLGGLDWGDVKPMIVDAFKELPQVRVVLFEPLVT